ncbi:MAG: AraC family transcriptional regulator [Spongiibacteraceae bacterium]
MDALSDVLQVVRLGGAVYLHGEFSAPWSVAGQSHSELCASFLPPAERIISYHLVTKGSCWAQLADDPASAMEIKAGELLVVPQGEPHILASALDLEPTSAQEMLDNHLQTSPGEIIRVAYGGGGDEVHLVCGFLACNETLSNPLIAMLPRIFKVDMRNDPRSAWLESSLQFAVTEAAEWRAGSTLVLGKLSELLFVEAIRRCIDSLPAEKEGWLMGLRDRFVGRALAFMHAQPARDWTVDELAKQVGLSRSALAQRFTDLVGQPPMQYLTRWRLQLAARELVMAGKPLLAIATQIGYDSEAAFTRAFKREFGMPPSSWRKERALG